MELAKKKEIHDDFLKISRSEGIDIQDIMREVASGHLVIIPNYSKGAPIALGKIVRSKVLCNFGTSSFCQDIDVEIEKVKIAIQRHASFVCDQSVGDHVYEHRKKLIAAIEVPIASIPLYQNVEESRSKKGDPLAFTTDEVLEVFERQIESGVTAPGIHTMNKELAKNYLDGAQRLMPIVSRGGGIINAWIKRYNAENPYLQHFDKILKIAKRYNVPLTFVTACRSGTVVDGFDECQKTEWKMLRSYIKMAHEEGVSIIVDGLGHMAMDQIPDAIKTLKEICYGVPLGVLGPAVTDRGLGHEHIVNAIGTAVAVWHGANYCNACYCTEHLGLPELQDIASGIAASLVATNIGDLARNEMKSTLLKEEMKISQARKNNRWGIMLECALDKEEAKITFNRVGQKNKDGQGCSICGDLCPFVITGQVQNKA
jgi:phosphomethylpyrimidine synthase